MRPVANLNINSAEFPEWFRPQWQVLNRAMSDITKIFSNGIVMSDNMSFLPRTISASDGQNTTVPHSLNRNPIVLAISGRLLGFKVAHRTSNVVEIWCKLPRSRITSGRGKKAEFSCEDASWFFPGDTVKVGQVTTSVTSVYGDTILTRDPVVIMPDMAVILQQETVDLLLF